MILERRERTVPASAAALFATSRGSAAGAAGFAWNSSGACGARSTGCSAASA